MSESKTPRTDAARKDMFATHDAVAMLNSKNPIGQIKQLMRDLADARDSLSRLQQVWAENAPAVRYKQERDAARDALRQIYELRRERADKATEYALVVEALVREILQAKP